MCLPADRNDIDLHPATPVTPDGLRQKAEHIGITLLLDPCARKRFPGGAADKRAYLLSVIGMTRSG
jgi:hypothetical protein